MKRTLDDVPFLNRTGRGVTIAVLDSGVHNGHPHVGRVDRGRSFVASTPDDDFSDQVGHGTAVAAAIREKSPAAELIAVRVFERQLSTNVAVLSDAIVWSTDAGAQLINLSLGTANVANVWRLAEVIDYAAARGSLIVSARESNGITWFPGALTGVASVVTDVACDRHAIGITRRKTDLPLFAASPYPRPIPGVPRERNVHGVSFAVANVTGFLARAVEACDGDPFWALREL